MRQKNRPQCKRHGCTATAQIRGLCGNDYLWINRKVRAGLITWEALEKAGKVNPAKGPKRHRNTELSAYFFGRGKERSILTGNGRTMKKKRTGRSSGSRGLHGDPR